MNEVVITELREAVGFVTLNRPSKLNAINHDLASSLLKGLQAMNNDPACKVILLSGQGTAFCAGDDLKDLGQGSESFDVADETISVLQEITRQIMFNKKPVLCAVQGWAVGAGFSWALNADLSYWAAESRAFLPEIQYGMYATGAATFLLSHRLGISKAMEMMSQSKKYPVAELERFGLVNEILAPEKLLETVFLVAEDMAKLSADALSDLKQGIIAPIKDQIESALKLEQQKCQQAVRTAMGTRELRSKTARFQDK